MAKRDYLVNFLRTGLQAGAPGLNHLTVFSMKKMNTINYPFCYCELSSDVYEFFDDEQPKSVQSGIKSATRFYVYLGVRSPERDVNDLALVEQEANRAIEQVESALQRLTIPTTWWTDVTTEYRIRLNEIQVRGNIPAVNDEEMTALVLVDGQISYTQILK